MTKAFGYNSQYLLARNGSTFGSNPGGNFNKVPVTAANLGITQKNVANKVVGAGRDPQSHIQDVIDVSGSATIPIDANNIGFWLTGLFGDAVTTGSGDPYTHTFKSGATSLPDYAHEVGHVGPGAFEMNLGVKVNSMQFTKPNTGGFATAVVNLLGSTNTKSGSSGGGTPVEQAKIFASHLQGVVKKGGTTLANITNFDFTYNNNLKGDRDTSSTGQLTAIDADEATLSGKMTSRFVDTTLYDIARAATTLDLELLYTLGTNRSLLLTMNEVLFEVSKASISGPGGYTIDFNFDGQNNASAGCMLTAVLVNALAGSVYA